MDSSKVIISIAIVFFTFSLSACDQITSRYELSKDSKGRTIRLDKRTGEMVILEGDTIISLKDAKETEREEQDATEQVGKFKYWPPLPLPNFKAEVKLTTVWRDGQMLYAVRFYPSNVSIKSDSSTLENEKGAQQEEIDAEAIIRAIQARTFTLHMLDAPFELATEELKFSRIVDNQNKPIALEAKGRIVMSRETYQEIDAWNVHWR